MQKEEEEIKKFWFSFKLTTIILAIIMLIIPATFFFLLNQQTGEGFGIVEVLFSIAFALVVTTFLVWVKSFMKARPYLGLIIGLVLLGSFEYSLFLKYLGPYTITFAIITGLIVLVYLLIYFFKFRKLNLQPEGFNDEI